MKYYLLLLPIAFMVAYSQVVIKWRVSNIDMQVETGFLNKLMHFMSDYIILSAYGSALFASFAWLYVVTKLPLITAFPIYIGLTFFMVIIGSWYFLAEDITLAKFVAITLILLGIVIGVRA
jgi:multidrug transporter EmrE-like cation transporter